MIHQFYFTHCTYATSALERKTDETARHPLGYSARAASVQKDALRDIFRKLERYVYYYLPSDTPAMEKENTLPSKAPCRLVFLPETECGTVLLNLSYRQKDTAGRIGSYFCHALTSDSKSASTATETKPGISMAAALQLWGAAGWVREDSDWTPHDIPALSSLASLLQNRSPAIDERVLNSFLRAETREAFTDPQNVVPERWKKMPVAERQRYFKLALFGFLTASDIAGASLLLVAEPSVAAIIFYGINIFLPKNLTRNVSFSTYEPNPERLFTKLAATVFQNPEKLDLPENLYAGQSFVLNTWNGRSTNFDAESLASSYVVHAWKQFQAGGMNQVQIFAQTFGAVGVSSASDLNAMMLVEKLFHQILADSESAETAGEKLPLCLNDLPIVSSKMAVTLLKRRLADGISKIMTAPVPEAEKRLARMVGTPGQLLLLELLGVGGNLPPVQKAVRYLAEALPEKCVETWLKNSSASDDFKAQILTRWLQQTHSLPAGCEFLWKLTMDSMELGASSNANSVPGPKPPTQNAKILPLALYELSPEVLLKCSQSPNVRDFQIELVLAYSLGVSRFVERVGALSEKASPIRKNIDQFIQNLPERLFLEIYRTCGNWFFQNYSGNSLVLGEKIASLEKTLYQEPKEISSRVQLLMDIQDVLPEDLAPRVRRWRALRKALQAIVTFQAQPGKKVQSRPLDQACEQLAQTACELFDDVRLLDESEGKKASEFAPVGKLSNAQRNRLALKEMDLLSSLCEQWFSVKFLPEGNRSHDLMRKKIKFYFQTKIWNTAKISAIGNQAVILIILGGIGIGLLAVLLFFLFISRSNSSEAFVDPSQGISSDTRLESNAPTVSDDENRKPETTGKTRKNKKSSKSQKSSKPSKPTDKDSLSSGTTESLTENSRNPSARSEPKEETYEMETESSAKLSLTDEQNELENALAENTYENTNESINANDASPVDRPDEPQISTVSESQIDGDFQNNQKKISEKLFLETPPETLDAWNREIDRNGFCRRLLIPMHSSSISRKFEPKNDGLNYALVSRKSIQDTGKFTSSEIGNLELVGGYVLFEGTAFPFGENPDCATPPTPNPAADNEQGIAASAVAQKKNAKTHVLKKEDAQKIKVKDEPGVLYHIPEIQKTLGLESVVLEMRPNEKDMRFLYVRLQKPFADSDAGKNLAEIEEQIQILEKQIAELQKAKTDCENSKKVRDQKLLDTLKKLAKLVGKTVLLTLPEVKDPQNDEQVEAFRQAQNRLYSQKMPQLLEIAAERIKQKEAELDRLRASIPAESGWTATEIQRINERLLKNPPQIMAVFSGNFDFNLPFPPKAEQLLKRNAAVQKNSSRSSSLFGESTRDRVDGDSASVPENVNPTEDSDSEDVDLAENDDPFGQSVPSTGIQPLDANGIRGNVRILNDQTDFETTLKTEKKNGNEIQIKLEGMGKKLPESARKNLLISMRTVQIRANESEPRYESFQDLTANQNNPVATIRLLPNVRCLLVTFQLGRRSADKNAVVSLTPYYQIWLDDDEEENEHRIQTLTLKLSSALLNQISSEKPSGSKLNKKTAFRTGGSASGRAEK